MKLSLLSLIVLGLTASSALAADIPLTVSHDSPSAVGICPVLGPTESVHTLTVSAKDAVKDKMVPAESRVLVSKRHGGVLWRGGESTETKFVATSPAGLVAGDSSWVVCAGRFQIKAGNGQGNGAGQPVKGPEWLAQAMEEPVKTTTLIVVHLYDKKFIDAMRAKNPNLATNDDFALEGKTIFNELLLATNTQVVPIAGYYGPDKKNSLSPNVDARTRMLMPIDSVSTTSQFITAQITAQAQGQLKINSVVSFGHGTPKPSGEGLLLAATPTVAWEPLNYEAWSNQLRGFLVKDSNIEMFHCFSGASDAAGSSPIKAIFSALSVADATSGAAAVPVTVVGVNGLGIVDFDPNTQTARFYTANGVSFVSVP